MKHQVVSVTEFKARCLSLLDEISKSGGRITITKRGRALATVGPADKRAWESSEGCLEGKFDIPDDIENVDTSDMWEVVRNPRSFDL